MTIFMIEDGNPEPDLVHATGCKQPTLRLNTKVTKLHLLMQSSGQIDGQIDGQMSFKSPVCLVVP
jgi:hypothetical protein